MEKINTKIEKKPHKQKRNHANKIREPTPSVILVPRALADF